MSEAPDSTDDGFESEFEAARNAETGDAPLAGEGEGEGGDGEDGGDEPAKSDAEVKAEKRATDLQKALKQERRKRQEDERKFNDRLAALERGSGAKDAPLDPAGLLAKLRDDEDDPIGDLATVKQLAKLLVGQTEQDRQQDQQTQQRNQALATVSAAMTEYETDFRELNPDYNDAARHFMNARMEELKDTGLEGQALTIAIQNDFAGIVSRSIAAGKDPAEIIYNMAGRRGFKAQVGNAKIDTIERGQAQSRTLAGGGAATGNLSMAKVAELKGAAFDSAFEKLRAAERRR